MSMKVPAPPPAADESEVSARNPSSAAASHRPSIHTSEPPANFIDIKIHGVYGAPPVWAADCGAAPVFNDHVFRYELDVAVAGVLHTFRNGRLLDPVETYASFVEGSKLPPVMPNLDEEDGGDAGTDVPSAAMGSAVPSARTAAGTTDPSDPAAASTSKRATEAPVEEGSTNANPATVPSIGGPAILWVLGPEVDTEFKEEAGKKDAKAAAPKKGAAVVPAAPPETIPPIPPNTDSPPSCIARIPLTMEQLAAFEEQVEGASPLSFTFRRVLRSGTPPEWEDAQEMKYSAKVHFSLKPFTEPGSKSIEASVPLEPVVPDAPREEEKGGKSKKAVPKKSKGSAPAILTEDLDPNEPHPYVANGTHARITLTAHSPITRLPQDRPRPDLQPSDMIPRRLLPPRRPVEATKRYSQELQGVVARIVRDYRLHKQNQPAGTASDDLRTTFLQALQTSGRTRVYQELLVPSVQGIVKETFIRKSAPTTEDMDRVSNELYTYLLDHLHLTLNRTFTAKPTPPEKASASFEGDPIERWRRLALEAEVMGEHAVASRYHQQRLVQCRDRLGEAHLPDVWCEYAEFCLRVRDALKAEQAYREALAIDTSHLPCMIGYGCLLLARQRFRESEVYLQCATDLDPSPLTWGCLALYFDMLLVSLADAPAAEEPRRAACRRESKYAMTQAVRLASEGNTDSPRKEGTPGVVYEALGRHMLALHHEEMANLCLARADRTPAVDALTARALKQTGQLEEAALLLQDVVSATPSDPEPKLLLGDVYAAMGGAKTADAEQQYDAALRIDPQCGTGPSYVRLGNLYSALGKHKDALSAFLVGAKVWPCGLTWLGVGVAYFRLDDLARAEQALSESNVLNSLNPKTWAYLSLVCLRQRREDEGDQAFNQAIKQSLSDSHLIAEVGAEQLRLSRHKLAEACFRRSLALREDHNTRMHLARTLAVAGRAAEARVEYAAVAQSTPNETQRAKAEEQMASLPAE